MRRELPNWHREKLTGIRIHENMPQHMKLTTIYSYENDDIIVICTSLVTLIVELLVVY